MHIPTGAATLALRPVRPGATSRPFFACGEELDLAPTTYPRAVTVPLPESLRCMYAHYPDDVEFEGRNWIFLSEREIAQRYTDMEQTRVVDVAIRYVGMGRIVTCTYDPITDTVFRTFVGREEVENQVGASYVDVDARTDRCDFDAWWAAYE